MKSTFPLDNTANRTCDLVNIAILRDVCGCARLQCGNMPNFVRQSGPVLDQNTAGCPVLSHRPGRIALRARIRRKAPEKRRAKDCSSSTRSGLALDQGNWFQI